MCCHFVSSPNSCVHDGCTMTVQCRLKDTLSFSLSLFLSFSLSLFLSFSVAILAQEQFWHEPFLTASFGLFLCLFSDTCFFIQCLILFLGLLSLESGHVSSVASTTDRVPRTVFVEPVIGCGIQAARAKNSSSWSSVSTRETLACEQHQWQWRGTEDRTPVETKR